MVNMSAGIVDADKLPLSVAAALLATEPACYTFVISPHNATRIFRMTFVSYHFHFYRQLNCKTVLLCSAGRESSFYDFMIWQMGMFVSKPLTPINVWFVYCMGFMNEFSKRRQIKLIGFFASVHQYLEPTIAKWGSKKILECCWRNSLWSRCNKISVVSNTKLSLHCSLKIYFNNK